MIRAELPRAFNTLVPRQSRGQAHAARGGARRARRLWRRRLDRRHDPRQVLDQPAHAPTCTASTACPTSPHHEAIPGHVWQGEYANKLPLIRTLLAFNAYSEGWALYAEQLADELGVYDDFPVGRLGYLQSIAFRAAGWSSTPASTPSAGPASRASTSSSTQRLEPARSRERSRPLLQLAGPGLRLQGRPQRDQPPARQARRRRSVRSYDLQGVRRRGGARRQRADGRAGQERRRLYRPGEARLIAPSPASRLPRGSTRASAASSTVQRNRTHAPGSCRGSRARRTSAQARPRLPTRSLRIVSSPSL